MSQENVELLRRTIEATVRGDHQAVHADLADGIEIDDTDIPDSDGHDSWDTWIGRWNEVWERWHVEDLDIRPVGDDRVIALFRMVAVGKGSGVELSRLDAMVATIRDGKLTKLGYYNDQAQALEAAGL